MNQGPGTRENTRSPQIDSPREQKRGLWSGSYPELAVEASEAQSVSAGEIPPAGSLRAKDVPEKMSLKALC